MNASLSVQILYPSILLSAKGAVTYTGKTSLIKHFSMQTVFVSVKQWRPIGGKKGRRNPINVQQDVWAREDIISTLSAFLV